MPYHPYSSLPDTQFWSSGVKLPVGARHSLAVEPIVDSLKMSDTIISGGSCFAQYIGKELSARGFNYLASKLSGERVESFGLGNIYTIAQLKQWLEFCTGQREWADDCVFEDAKQWYDLLLPHRDALTSRSALEEHRFAVKDEMVAHLESANVLIFTVGLTETWRNTKGDILPTCPGTLIGEFDESKHFFHNCTFSEIYADFVAVENMLVQINPEIRLVYTVSPVPLTATASDDHVLLATTYSKSVIRAAVGEYCAQSQNASYFPSYELIGHHSDGDWRFENNLRSISEAGVRYVMGHAFGESQEQFDSGANAADTQPRDRNIEAVCEEELLESYSRLAESAPVNTDIVLVGDCHMEKLATGFRTANVDVVGGIVMHGSSFTDYKFDMSEERIFQPTDSEEELKIWIDLYDKMVSKDGCCHIITNIGFHTHRTINTICNHFGVYVLTETNVADYFKQFYPYQVQILRELTQYGKVWMVEDPDFHAFIGNKDNSQLVRDKNFHQYCNHMRKVAQNLGIEYLNPCDLALQNLIKDSVGLNDIITSDGFLGTPKYYEYCAAVVNETIRGSEVDGYSATTMAVASAIAA